MEKELSYRNKQKKENFIEKLKEKQELSYNPNWLEELANVEIIENLIERNNQKIKNTTYRTMEKYYKEENEKLTEQMNKIKINMFEIGDVIKHIVIKRNGVVVGKVNNLLQVEIDDNGKKIVIGCHPNNLQKL